MIKFDNVLSNFCNNEIQFRWQKANESWALYLGKEQGNIDVRYLWNNYQDPQSLIWDDPSFGSVPEDNVIKSVIDSAASKLSQVKPTSRAVPIGGNYDTRKTAISVQKFIDFFFQEEKLNSLINKGLLYKMIFGKHFYFINPWMKKIQSLKDWECGLLNPEVEHGDPQHCLIKIDWFPTSIISQWIPVKEWGLDKSHHLQRERVDFYIWIDCSKKHAVIFFNNEPVKEVPWDYDSIPIIYDFFYDPVLGTYSQSVIDLIRGIQFQINNLNKMLNNVAKRIPAVVGFVNSQGPVKKSDIGNEIVQIFETVGGDASFNLSSPSINLQWIVGMLEDLHSRAFERIGISELSAMSKKPADLSSGKSMQVYSDIESARFQYQVDLLLDLFVRIIKGIIKFFPSEAQILPDNPFNVKWSDLKEEINKMKIQFYPSDVFGSSPEQKINMIQNLASMGLIPMNKIAQLLQLPDLDDAYSFLSAGYDAVQKLIDKTIESDSSEGEEAPFIPEYISLELLLKETILLQNKLYASDDPADKTKLKKLLSLQASVMEKMITDGLIQIPVEQDPSQVQAGQMAQQDPNQMAVDQQQAVQGGM